MIKDAAVKQGMRTLRDDGWRNVRTGVTTVAEVVRVTQEEVVRAWGWLDRLRRGRREGGAPGWRSSRRRRGGWRSSGSTASGCRWCRT